MRRTEINDAAAFILKPPAQPTAQQPEINVVRTTIQALAAVLGGTQSLQYNLLDEALGLRLKTGRIALRTQQVIAHESGIADTVDPLAGSSTRLRN